MIPKSLNNSLFTTDLKGIKQHMNGTSTLRAFEITNKNLLPRYLEFYGLKPGDTEPTKNWEYHLELAMAPCIYFLFNDNNDEVYFGKTDRGGLIRLSEHYLYKEFWTHAIIIYHRDALRDNDKLRIINGHLKKDFNWDNEPMGYFEEAIWCELDKQSYIVTYVEDEDYDIKNKREPGEVYRSSYKADKDIPNNPKLRFIQDIATYVEEAGCNIFTKYKGMEHKEELSNIDNKNIKLPKEKIKELQREFGYVPTYYTKSEYAKRYIENIVSNIWNELMTKHNYNTIQAAKELSGFQFLNIACKFKPEFMGYLETALNEKLKIIMPNNLKRTNHIHNKMLFGICLRPDMEEEYHNYYDGSADQQHNNFTWLYDYVRLVNNRKINIQELGYRILSKYKYALGDEKMKFDVVIGNPPYQDVTTTIYQDFIDLGIALGDRVSMIVKNNWINSNTLKPTRDNMIKAGLKQIIAFSKLHEIFSDNANVYVNIFYIEKGYEGETEISRIEDGKTVDKFRFNLVGISMISTNKMDCALIKRFGNNVNNFGVHSLGTEPFGLTSSGKIGRDNKRTGELAPTLDQSDTKDDTYIYKVAYMDKSGNIYYKYTKPGEITQNASVINEFKVIAGGRFNHNENVITNINPLGQQSLCSSSYAILFHGTDRILATKAYYYIKTKLFRALTRILCEDGMTNMSPYRFSLIPDIAEIADKIDWTAGLTSIDKQLYAIFNLSDEEIDYIESTINESPLPTSQVKEKQKPTLTKQDLEANYINKISNK